MTELNDAADIIKSGAFEKIADLFHKLAGPLAEEVGLLMAERVREYRVKNIVSVFNKTKRLLASSRLPPNAVPPRIFLPILDACSLENNESLQELWAGLLASASQESDDFSPSFVETLKQLTPNQAIALKECFDYCLRRDNLVVGTPKTLKDVILSKGSTLQLTINAFERLGVMGRIYGLSHNPKNKQSFFPSGPIKISVEGKQKLSYSLGFTQYGIQFMTACLGPSVEMSG